MWIIISVLIAVVFLFLIQFYFARKIKVSIKTLFPNFPDKKRKIIVSVFLLLLNVYPVLLIINSVYAAITKQSIVFPQNVLADYLILYPFWIFFIIIVQTCLFFLIIDLFKLLLFPLYKKYKEKLYSLQAKLFLAVIAFFIIYVPARVIYDYHKVNIRSVEIKQDNLPKI